jgi:hypothetical protein
VTAIQCRPCSGGFWVVTGKVLKDCAKATAVKSKQDSKVINDFIAWWFTQEPASLPELNVKQIELKFEKIL